MLRGAAVLVAICYFDLLSSIILINLGIAVETGPVLKTYCQEWGMPGLISGKVLMVGLGFFLIETAWRTERIKKTHAEICYWFCIVIFLLLYAILFCKENNILF